jgi:erythrin-vacuolar iron transport family protein
VKRFADDLNEQEILALAISNEDEDNRIYRSFGDALRPSYPDTAEMYDKMAQEEIGHRDMLLELHRKKFGDFLPLIRRQDVKGFVPRRPIWLNRPLAIDATRKFAEEMEYETARFYRRAAENANDDSVRDLLKRLAAAEDKHEALAQELGRQISPQKRAAEDDTARRMFVLQYVQPGLAGLMDGSVSTLAPLFAAAFATHNTWSTFLVGLAAAIGAGISMGFAEALSDDGSLTGRGSAGDARRSLRRHDCHRRPRPHPALSHSALLHRDFGCLCRRRHRAYRDLLDPHALYGHAVPAGRVPGRGRRRPRFCRRHSDRQFVIFYPASAMVRQAY